MKCKFVITKEEAKKMILEKIKEQFQTDEITLILAPNYSDNAFEVEAEIGLFKEAKEKEAKPCTTDIQPCCFDVGKFSGIGWKTTCECECHD